jgi:hypothetical protein
VQVVDVFCAADEVNGALRRGQMSWVKRERFQSGTWSRWELQEQHRYAQLVSADRTFEQITGEQDLNRPLWLRGDFTDDELIALVKFLRSRPTWTGGTAREQIEGEWPVTVVWREADGTVVASLNKNYLEGQRVTLRQSANEWTIVTVSFWIA